jgi:hypothetical protein
LIAGNFAKINGTTINTTVSIAMMIILMLSAVIAVE